MWYNNTEKLHEKHLLENTTIIHSVTVIASKLENGLKDAVLYGKAGVKKLT